MAIYFTKNIPPGSLLGTVSPLSAMKVVRYITSAFRCWFCIALMDANVILNA